MPEPVTPADEREESAPSVFYDTRLPELTRWQRMQIPIIGWAGYWLVRLIGSTMRFEVLGWQNAQRVYDAGKQGVYAFWHRTIFPATWWWRNRGVVVMSTTNFDGRWTQRIIRRFGYDYALGSSTRGGLRALAEMARRLEEGHDAAFTIDGPRGPRYVAKPGPVMLARRTGFPILVFHIGLESAHTMKKTWDLTQIPYPFTHAVMPIAPPIEVPQDADRELVQAKHAEMQKALERCRDVAESWFQLPPEERDRLRTEWNA